MNKIIILGCGYIGTNLANFIAENYPNEEVYILGIENEYNKFLNLKVKFISKMIEQINSEDKEFFNNSIVIDAVGNTNATNDSKSSSTLFLENCKNKIELIRKIDEYDIKKYIFLSSGGTVYNDSEKPHKEDEKLLPSNIYSLEKIIIENYLRINELESSTLKYLILRLSNPYGGIVSKYKNQGIIDVAIRKIKNNEKIEFYGELDNIRDYIYIDNLCEYIYKLAVSDYKNEIYNIGTGIGVSVYNIFNYIEKTYSKKLIVENKKINTINIHSNILDVSKLENNIKINNIYTVLEGIERDKNNN